MTIGQMRDYILNAYPGDKWKARCRCMRSNQVIAIFHSLQSRDRDKKKEARQVKPDTAGIQLTIFDALKEERNGQQSTDS